MKIDFIIEKQLSLWIIKYTKRLSYSPSLPCNSNINPHGSQIVTKRKDFQRLFLYSRISFHKPSWVKKKLCFISNLVWGIQLPSKYDRVLLIYFFFLFKLYCNCFCDCDQNKPFIDSIHVLNLTENCPQVFLGFIMFWKNINNWN